MKLRCPACGEGINSETLLCGAGHAYQRGPGGVTRLMTPDFAERIDRLERALTDYLIAPIHASLEPADYADLPERPAARGLPAWQGRVRDLELIRRRLPKQSGLKILDIGAWNGWLSEALSQDGHHLVAVSYFGADVHGLGARVRYVSPVWEALQMDEARLDGLAETFDVVVLNRCLHTSVDPVARLRAGLDRARPGGFAIATGLPVYADPGRVAAEFAAREASFQARYGIPLMIAPGKDWLIPLDIARLKRAGATVGSYPGHWRRELRARLVSDRPVLRYLEARAS